MSGSKNNKSKFIINYIIKTLSRREKKGVEKTKKKTKFHFSCTNESWLSRVDDKGSVGYWKRQSFIFECALGWRLEEFNQAIKKFVKEEQTWCINVWSFPCTRLWIIIPDDFLQWGLFECFKQ